jgi:hypothetical protein
VSGDCNTLWTRSATGYCSCISVKRHRLHRSATTHRANLHGTMKSGSGMPKVKQSSISQRLLVFHSSASRKSCIVRASDGGGCGDQEAYLRLRNDDAHLARTGQVSPTAQEVGIRSTIRSTETDKEWELSNSDLVTIAYRTRLAWCQLLPVQVCPIGTA